ncbi:protein synthesis inhibitor II-like [Panicum miliaceum]|uniref:rRNA N-glycosylase n=1 Tax=Panicum miliaceum TaxID=4540 RepID=A0A3L6RX18_PANMI|nr:protein synthesis inhibitor II-like [Panicum miliaceum]
MGGAERQLSLRVSLITSGSRPWRRPRSSPCTVAFDLASSDDYGAFLTGIRDKLGNPRHVSHDRPVLPPAEPGVDSCRAGGSTSSSGRRRACSRSPPAPTTSTWRASRAPTGDGTWWELSHGTFPSRCSGLIPCAAPLGFRSTYRDLVGGAREVANVALGRRRMAEGVDALAARTRSGGAAERRLAKDALTVLLLMVHEATRFLDVAATVAGLMRPVAEEQHGKVWQLPYQPNTLNS